MHPSARGCRPPSYVDVDPALVTAAEGSFGRPHGLLLVQELRPWELDLIESVCGDRRFHDVTVFIRHGDDLALIRKPDEPAGAYWAPAGGLEAGERLEEAARREVWEETGLEVAIERYVLRVRVHFLADIRCRPWTSHVFLASARDRDLCPQDRHEVEAAAWVPVDRFWQGVAPVLAQSGWGRFAYRLRLADAFYTQLGWGGPLAKQPWTLYNGAPEHHGALEYDECPEHDDRGSPE